MEKRSSSDKMKMISQNNDGKQCKTVRFHNMNDRDLKNMNRQELLELILAQSRRIQQLEQALSDAEERAQSREIRLANCGSIAEAALSLSGFFEAADRAARLYIENVKQHSADAPENSKDLVIEK